MSPSGLFQHVPGDGGVGGRNDEGGGAPVGHVQPTAVPPPPPPRTWGGTRGGRGARAGPRAAPGAGRAPRRGGVGRGGVGEPGARNAPRHAASASHTPPDTTGGGRPRTGRPRTSS